jgi:hypothetical protein
MPTRKVKVKKNTTKTLNAARARRAKKQCAFQPFKLEKKDAFTMADLIKHKAKVVLDEATITRLLNDYGYYEDNAKFKHLKGRLMKRKFDIDYVGDFYETPDDYMIWELSCMYNDMKKIKEFLLERQIQSLLGSLGKGYIEISDL